MAAENVIASAYPSMASYARELVAAAGRIGIDPSWLANVINFESGGNPQARNPISGATGIIQFMPSTARTLGTTTDALFGMTGAQQMGWVERYFRPYVGRLRSQEDVYMAVFYPAYIGKPDTQFPANVTASNPGIYTPRDYVAKANDRAKLKGVLLGAAGAAYTYGPAAALMLAALTVSGLLVYRFRPELFR